jgi:hypothetical protein
MKHSRIRQGVYLAAALTLAAVSFDHLSYRSVQAQDVRIPLALEPGKLAPADDLRSAVSQAAAIVEGIVTDIQYEYSEEQGPWTRVILSKVRAISGAAPETIELRHFGGPLPKGALMVAAELPVFVRDRQYIVFLRNTSWNVSPVVGDFAFRVDNVDNAEVVVNSDGQPVIQLSTRGIEFGPTLFEAFDTDGSAPKAITGSLRAIDYKPLDREGFTASLVSTLDAQGLRATGTFIEKPAGEFNWRRQTASASPLAPPPVDVPDGREPEPDTPELKF